MPGENDELDPKDALDETVPQDETPDDAGESDAEEEVDAEEDDGEAEEVDGEPVGDEAPPRRPNRAQTRIQTLANEARENKARADKLERDLAEVRAAVARQNAPQQETPEARAVRRATMAPEEIMREDLRESEARTQAMVRQMAAQQQETLDRQAYNEIMRENPALKRYDAEVERIRLEQQAAGNFVPREALLDLVIGRAARAAAKTKPGGGKQPRRAAAPQRTQPARSRGDTAPAARGRQGSTPESRLEDVPI